MLLKRYGEYLVQGFELVSLTQKKGSSEEGADVEEASLLGCWARLLW